MQAFLFSVLLVAAAIAVAISGVSARQQPVVRDLTEIASWDFVDYNWTGSPWANKEEATRAGAYIEANNIITGINVWQKTGAIFVCVPRWRTGVPATLSTIALDQASGRWVLNPWPSWSWNIDARGDNSIHYSQSVFIDQKRDTIHVIDTGREYFFDSNKSAVINRNARLLVFDLNGASAASKPVYAKVFSADIFSPTTSFLNDIMVDTSRMIAYMSDTNMNPLGGGIVVHNLLTGFTRRFQDNVMNSTLADLTFQVVINGILYPINNPCDGIALSDDGATLFYAAVDSEKIFALNATLLASPSASFADILSSVRQVQQRWGAGDGLKIMPSPQPGMVEHLIYGSNSHSPQAEAENIASGNAIYDAAFSVKGRNGVIPVYQKLLEKDDYSMQWADAFARVDINETVSHLYFTTNKLQRYFAGTMDFSGRDGANMRIFRLTWDLTK